MPRLRSETVMSGRQAAGARALWRAAGLAEQDLGKPLVAIANSFSEFVPGHLHLRTAGDLVADGVRARGALPRQFNTIAIDDGIANGHLGMLYSLPSRELIADSVEYVVEAHRADALVCISNCDKITPGMLMAALRLNVPTVFVSGGPMEAGRDEANGGSGLDLISAIVASLSPEVGDDELLRIERRACPTCGSCSGMFSANSMNCLVEALGLGLPGNGTLLATHARRRALFEEVGRTVVDLIDRWYGRDDDRALPRVIAGRDAFRNAMTADISMGGSTNTVLHLLAAAGEAGIDFDLDDIDQLSRDTPVLCKLAPSSARHIEDLHRAGGMIALLRQLDAIGLIEGSVATAHSSTLRAALNRWQIEQNPAVEAVELFSAAPTRTLSAPALSGTGRVDELDTDRVSGCIRAAAHAFAADGGLAILRGSLAPDGSVVKTAALPAHRRWFQGPAVIVDSQEEAVTAIIGGRVVPGSVLVIRCEGPRGGPGMQEMLHPTSVLAGHQLSSCCALVTDGRFSGGSAGLSIGHVAPEAAAAGPIGLVETGDRILIDIDARRIDLVVTAAELNRRRAVRNARGWRPSGRDRPVSRALATYAATVASAADGAIRLDPRSISPSMR